MLSLGWLIYFSFGLINTATAPLVSHIMGDLGLTYTQMGVIIGAWQLIYIFSSQPLGVIIDRLGVYRSLLLGGIIIAASSSLRYLATDFWNLFTFVAMFGLGGPLISIGTLKLVSTWFIDEGRGTASGINASGGLIGSMTALSITNGFVLPLVGDWRNVFLVYGFMGYAIAFIWLLLGRRPPPAGLQIQKIPSMTSEGGTGAYRFLLKNKDIWLILGIGIIFFLTTHGLKNWMPRILELKGLSPVMAGFATSFMALSSIFGNLTIPRLSYRIGSKRRTIALILFFSSISILMLEIGGDALLWTGIMLSGFFTAAIMPLMTLTLMDMPEVGAELMGTAGGLFFSIGEIGGFLGPFLMGYFKDITGSFFSGILFLSIMS